MITPLWIWLNRHPVITPHQKHFESTWNIYNFHCWKLSATTSDCYNDKPNTADSFLCSSVAPYLLGRLQKLALRIRLQTSSPYRPIRNDRKTTLWNRKLNNYARLFSSIPYQIHHLLILFQMFLLKQKSFESLMIKNLLP